MNNLLAASSRMAARAMAALIMLGLATPGAFAAEQHRSSDRAGSAGASGNTSVNRELQRLFNQSGQQMPSMRTADLPYVTTPQMYRVRKRAAEPAGPKKKKIGLFSKVFGRFRRDKSDEEVAAPKPPPIVMDDRQAIDRRKDGAIANSRVPQQRRSQQRHDVANHQSQSLRNPQQDSAQSVQNRQTVRQVSQSQKLATEQAGSIIPRADMASQDEFVNPFKDGTVFSEGEVCSDLDAIDEIPDVADNAVYSSTDSFDRGQAARSELITPEPEEKAAVNPFSGSRIAADDEFEGFFEESIVDVDPNASPEADEAAHLIPQTASAVSEVDDLGFIEYYELLNQSEEAKTDSAAVETPESTDFDSGWQTPVVSDDLPSVERTNEFASGNRRTADLPYATTPQMYRVRKRAAEPAGPKKKKIGLFSKVFGRFRRDKSDEEVAAPKPPPIVMDDRQAIDRRKDGAIANSRVPQQRRSQQRHDVANHQSQSLRNPQQDSAQSVQNRQTVRQVSQSQKLATEQAGSIIPRADMASQDEFVNPFKDGTVFSEGEVCLDLDAIDEIPDVADNAVYSSTDSFDRGQAARSELITPEPEEKAAVNPFSGSRIAAGDEFEGFFEESIVDVDPNASPEADEAAHLIPQTASAVSEVDDLGFIEYYELLNQSEEAKTDSAAVETPESTDFDSGWQTPVVSDDLPPVERTNEFASENRRLARVDRISAERQEAQRWTLASDTGRGVEQTTGEWSFSEYAAVNSASTAPKASLQQIRRQKIKSRRHLSGFMGFCPVALREDRDLVDVSEGHEARFGLKTYHFSSAEACDRFKANPTRYAPAAGGADVVALVNSGEQYAGSLEFAMWYRDRLYLFRSHETVDLFRADPAIFGDQY